MPTTIVPGDIDGATSDLIVIFNADISGWTWQIGIADASQPDDRRNEGYGGLLGDDIHFGGLASRSGRFAHHGQRWY